MGMAMPKYRIYDEDGIFRGGLFNSAVHNRSNSRAWTGTPRPYFTEHLFDISEGEWILLRLSDEPRISGSRECDSEFDEASHGTRLSDESAQRWFIRNELSPPADLLARLASTSDASVGLGGRGEGAGSLAEIADAGVRAQPPPEHPPSGDSRPKGRVRADPALDSRVREQLKAGGLRQSSAEIADRLGSTTAEIARSRSRIRAANSRAKPKRSG